VLLHCSPVDVDSYIAIYSPEWQRLEKAIARGSRGLAKLPGPEIADVVRLYLRASAHLAEVQTRYYDRRLLEYLNALVARAHAAVYAARPRTFRGLVRLFGERYREAIRRTVPFILVVAGLLLVVSVTSMAWVVTSKEAQVGLLPPAAREAIRRATGGASGIPIAPAGLSTFILLNNVQVALLAFGAGIALGIGTLFVVVQNALLLGVLAGAFQASGKGALFWSLVLPHGLLELTAICIAAGAGLRMGWSLIEPGDRDRSLALVQEARDAVIVVVGVVPAFVVAALIEGFLTGRVSPGFTVPLGVLVAVAYAAFLFLPALARPHPGTPTSVRGL
jgi:uncharacterized membrane protein SpoIIM required for sporulation